MAPDSRIEGKLHTWVGHSCNKQGDSAGFWSSFKFCSSKFLKRLFSDLKDSSFSSTGLFLVSLTGSCWWFSWRWWCWVNSIAFHATSATSMTVFATSTAPWPPMGTFCWFFLMLKDRAKLVFLYDLRVPESSLVLMVLTRGGMIGIFSFLSFPNRCG